MLITTQRSYLSNPSGCSLHLGRRSNTICNEAVLPCYYSKAYTQAVWTFFYEGKMDFSFLVLQLLLPLPHKPVALLLILYPLISLTLLCPNGTIIDYTQIIKIMSLQLRQTLSASQTCVAFLTHFFSLLLAKSTQLKVLSTSSPQKSLRDILYS